MKTLRIRDDILIILDNVTRVVYEENDARITADNQCSIFFVGSGNDAMVIRGADAKKVFEVIESALDAKPIG